MADENLSPSDLNVQISQEPEDSSSKHSTNGSSKVSQLRRLYDLRSHSRNNSLSSSSISYRVGGHSRTNSLESNYGDDNQNCLATRKGRHRRQHSGFKRHSRQSSRDSNASIKMSSKRARTNSKSYKREDPGDSVATIVRVRPLFVGKRRASQSEPR